MVKKAFLFELEYVPLPGRQTIYKAAADALDRYGVTVETWMMSRYGLNFPVDAFISAVVKQTRSTDVPVNDVVAATQEQVHESFANAANVNPSFCKLVDEVRAAGFVIGALTCLPLSTARPLAERVGMRPDEAIVLCGCHRDGHCVSADGWLMLTRQVRVPPPRSVAITASPAGCRAAVQAGMHCLVVPDTFTGYADFGGCDGIVDDVANLSLNKLLSLSRLS
jgi:beta-phosphoglucomutase-like phosphatase (HAD superfamily)